jgi:hypothetical protein
VRSDTQCDARDVGNLPAGGGAHECILRTGHAGPHLCRCRHEWLEENMARKHAERERANFADGRE